MRLIIEKLMPGQTPEKFKDKINYEGRRPGDIKCCFKGDPDDRKTEVLAALARRNLYRHGVPHSIISILAYCLTKFPFLDNDDKLMILKSTAKAGKSH